MTTYPLRIHLSSLPTKLSKSLSEDADPDGYIHGYFAYNERDPFVMFMGKRVLFECTRPHTRLETHLIRYLLDLMGRVTHDEDCGLTLHPGRGTGNPENVVVRPCTCGWDERRAAILALDPAIKQLIEP